MSPFFIKRCDKMLKEYELKNKIFAVKYNGRVNVLPDEIKERIKETYLGRLYFKGTNKKAISGNMIVLIGNSIDIISSETAFNKYFKEAVQ